MQLIRLIMKKFQFGLVIMFYLVMELVLSWQYRLMMIAIMNLLKNLT